MTVEATTAALATIEQIEELLRAHRFRFGSERQLQDGIERILGAAGIAAEREHRLAVSDRVDFLVAGGVALEVKVAGTADAAQRQLQRYSRHDAVTGLLLATASARHGDIARTMNGKPVGVVMVRRVGSLL